MIIAPPLMRYNKLDHKRALYNQCSLRRPFSFVSFAVSPRGFPKLLFESERRVVRLYVDTVHAHASVVRFALRLRWSRGRGRPFVGKQVQHGDRTHATRSHRVSQYRQLIVAGARAPRAQLVTSAVGPRHLQGLSARF